MSLPRCLHKLYAKAFGYFWFPCPICKEYFGGHEWKDPRAVIWVDTGGGAGVCGNCIEAAEEISRKNRKAYVTGEYLVASIKDSI